MNTKDIKAKVDAEIDALSAEADELRARLEEIRHRIRPLAALSHDLERAERAEKRATELGYADAPTTGGMFTFDAPGAGLDQGRWSSGDGGK